MKKIITMHLDLIQVLGIRFLKHTEKLLEIVLSPWQDL